MKVFSRIFQDAELLTELREAVQMKNKNAVLLMEWASVDVLGVSGSRIIGN